MEEGPGFGEKEKEELGLRQVPVEIGEGLI